MRLRSVSSEILYSFLVIFSRITSARDRREGFFTDESGVAVDMRNIVYTRVYISRGKMQKIGKKKARVMRALVPFP